MARISIKLEARGGYVVPERLSELEKLAASLRHGDRDVLVEAGWRAGGRRSFTWQEVVFIYVSGQVGAVLAPKVIEDLYEAAKAWARLQFARKRSKPSSQVARPEELVILGPDGLVLKRWIVDRDGEREG